MSARVGISALAILLFGCADVAIERRFEGAATTGSTSSTSTPTTTSSTGAGGAHACGCGEWQDCWNGTCVTTLAATLGITATVVHDADVYWSALDVYAGPHGLVARVPAEGGSPDPVVLGQAAPLDLRSNGASLAWVDHATGTLFAMPLPAGEATVVWAAPPGQSVRLLALSGETAWLSVGGALARTSLDGSAYEVVASGFEGGVSAADATADAVYFTTLGPEVVTDSVGHPEGLVARLALDSLAVSIVADHVDTPSAIEVRDGVVYWAEAGSLATYDVEGTSVNLGTIGRVARASTDGSGRVSLLEGVVQATSIELDDVFVYVASRGTVGGVDPNDVGWVSDGAVTRVPRGGGSAETLLDRIDASALSLSPDAVFFGSWNYGVVLRVDLP